MLFTSNMNFLVTFLASFLIWFMFFGLLVLWVIDGKIKREQVLHALISSFAAWIIAQIIKEIFPTTRPFELNNLVPLVLMPIKDGAFPSSHTALSFAMACSLWLHDKKIGGIFILSAFLVGLSRILAHVHYPVDILGGAVLGSVVAIAIEKVHPRLDF